ncbi:RagB/SusD family nutrient uptake outer membrane protein [Bacteroides thetaiotaomicron]|nr:RagB/SusD family nutrient uptake outer membrane protein [Bacteroides thetaiotaomicron]
MNNPDNADYGKLGIYFPRWNDKSGMSNNAKRFYPFKQDDEYVWYPQSTALPVLETASDRMPMVRKFSDTKIQWGEGGSREDVIFRLGDTYLLCAEAYLGVPETRNWHWNASTVYVSVPLKMRPLMKQ